MFKSCYRTYKKKDLDPVQTRSQTIALSICQARTFFWINSIFLMVVVGVPLFLGSEYLLTQVGWSHTEFTMTQLASSGAFTIGFLNILAIYNVYLPSSHNIVIWANIVYYMITFVVLSISHTMQHHPESVGILGGTIASLIWLIIWVYVAASLNTVSDEEINEILESL